MEGWAFLAGDGGEAPGRPVGRTLRIRWIVELHDNSTGFR